MMLQVLLLLAPPRSTGQVNVPKLLNAPQGMVEQMIGKAFKPKRDPGYFFTPKGYDVIRIDGFGPQMSAVMITFNDLLTPSQALAKIGVAPSRSSLKSLPDPPKAQIQMVRKRYEIRIEGFPTNPKTHKPWLFEYEQDGYGNAIRAKSLKIQIQTAVGQKRLDLIQSCYDWRSKILIDSR